MGVMQDANGLQRGFSWLLKGFEVAGKNYGRPIESYLAAGVTYFVLCYSLSWAVKRLHKKIAIIR